MAAADAIEPSPGASSVAPARVLYVGGAGRSGSTLLDLLLNEVPGIFAAGEVRYIWNRGVAANELCGCGHRFLSCPFWTAVGARAFGGWDAVNVDEVLHLQRSVDRHAAIPLMVRPRLRGDYGRRLRRFGETLECLYRAIAEVAGAEVVVDSTKRPSSAFLLASIPSIDLRFVQLVRDSRGVAFSWSKRVERPEVVDRVDFMPRYSSAEAGLRWMANNSLFHLLARTGVPGMRLRYEALVQAPAQELKRVVRHAGLAAPGGLAFVERRPVELRTNHVVAGNPLRLRDGLDLRLDEAWRAQMGRRDRSTVLLLTWPLLLRYGYLGAAAAAADRGAGAR
jgi:hypothetical protein